MIKANESLDTLALTLVYSSLYDVTIKTGGTLLVDEKRTT
jgi:hypothetical protein